MFKIEFKYIDKYSHGKWNTQTCTVPNLDQFKKFYGLEKPDVKYEIISIVNLAQKWKERLIWK